MPPVPSPILVGLLGFGNIGTGVVRALATNGALLAERLGGVEMRLARIADKDTERVRDCPYDPAIVGGDANALIDDPSIHVVIELVGGVEPARTFVERALKAGKHVVTANKALMAAHGTDLLALAAQRGVSLLFEASVGGGIPLIRTLELGLSANRIERVAGIVNGTCNYILTAMAEEGRAYGEVLAEAQKLGYAEPDPTFDVEGLDTAHKTAVLAGLAFGQDVRAGDVSVEGITGIRPADLASAAELGMVVKLLGIAKRGPVPAGGTETDAPLEVRVHPTMVPKTNLLAGVRGVFNAVLVDGDLTGQTLFYGRGAGASPTASAILSDVMAAASALARGADAGAEQHRLRVTPGFKNMTPAADVVSAYHIRVAEGAGERLDAALAAAGVAVEKSHAAGGDRFVVTAPCPDGVLRKALAGVEGAHAIRIEDL